MAEQTVCPQCSTPVLRHCEVDQCDWLACTACKIIYGHSAFILYGKAKEEDEARKRRNGA